MAAELRLDVAALRDDLEALLLRVGHQCVDQCGRDATPTDLGRDQRMVGDPRLAAGLPCQPAYRIGSGQRGAVFAARRVAGAGNF